MPIAVRHTSRTWASMGRPANGRASAHLTGAKIIDSSEPVDAALYATSFPNSGKRRIPVDSNEMSAVMGKPKGVPKKAPVHSLRVITNQPKDAKAVEKKPVENGKKTYDTSMITPEQAFKGKKVEKSANAETTTENTNPTHDRKKRPVVPGATNTFEAYTSKIDEWVSPASTASYRSNKVITRPPKEELSPPPKTRSSLKVGPKTASVGAVPDGTVVSVWPPQRKFRAVATTPPYAHRKHSSNPYHRKKSIEVARRETLKGRRHVDPAALAPAGVPRTQPTGLRTFVAATTTPFATNFA